MLLPGLIDLSVGSGGWTPGRGPRLSLYSSTVFPAGVAMLVSIVIGVAVWVADGIPYHSREGACIHHHPWRIAGLQGSVLAGYPERDGSRNNEATSSTCIHL